MIMPLPGMDFVFCDSYHLVFNAEFLHPILIFCVFIKYCTFNE